MADVPRDPPIVAPPIRLAVCVSGGGTTLQNLIDKIKAKKLRAEIVQVVASKPRIGAIKRADAAGLPLALANRSRCSNGENRSESPATIRRGTARSAFANDTCPRATSSAAVVAPGMRF